MPSLSTKSLGTQSLSQKGSGSSNASHDTSKKQIIPDIAIGEYEPDMKQETEEEQQQKRQREKIKEIDRLCPPVDDRSGRDSKVG